MEPGFAPEMIRGISSAGRAPALQAGGRRFDPVILHQYFDFGHASNRLIVGVSDLASPVVVNSIGCRSLTIHRVEISVVSGNALQSAPCRWQRYLIVSPEIQLSFKQS
jgi:hypothetical protein